MSVSAFKKPEQAPLKVVDNKRKADITPANLHAVNAVEALLNKLIPEIPEPTLQIVDPRPLADKFTITFSYGQQLHRTKVVMVGSGYRKPAYIYKVALNSRLSETSRMCWLQQTTQGWAVLMGDNIDSALINAITSAIESME